MLENGVPAAPAETYTLVGLAKLLAHTAMLILNPDSLCDENIGGPFKQRVRHYSTNRPKLVLNPRALKKITALAALYTDTSRTSKDMHVSHESLSVQFPPSNACQKQVVRVVLFGREVQRILMELLNQMDGFDQTVNVKVIMATNRADTLDPALLRPGRLDRKIEFPLPDRRQKRLVFQVGLLSPKQT